MIFLESKDIVVGIKENTITENSVRAIMGLPPKEENKNLSDEDKKVLRLMGILPNNPYIKDKWGNVINEN